MSTTFSLEQLNGLSYSSAMSFHEKTCAFIHTNVAYLVDAGLIDFALFDIYCDNVKALKQHEDDTDLLKSTNAILWGIYETAIENVLHGTSQAIHQDVVKVVSNAYIKELEETK